MQKYHDEPKQYKGYLKSALVPRSEKHLVFFPAFDELGVAMPVAPRDVRQDRPAAVLMIRIVGVGQREIADAKFSTARRDGKRGSNFRPRVWRGLLGEMTEPWTRGFEGAHGEQRLARAVRTLASLHREACAEDQIGARLGRA